ncbi:hypothetical protein BDQ94DRAFT_138406 [Aspergillus welwitschiae]|uniref:Uncharacterized protein n=1 Tax=Aspergillus welwitschiae TaxID=1341132 RepID=A0A3F3QCI8_9EURO|nr:hypothetical protein BDQ94DRAFT_138406 [Aspergillus welwitschiae]RDH36769.1 hypothetical protein BDQ94DRAFT_138406 [Aspergillus welwitschiae]
MQDIDKNRTVAGLRGTMQAKIITGVMRWTCWTISSPETITPSSQQCNLNNWYLIPSHHITSQVFGRRWGWMDTEQTASHRQRQGSGRFTIATHCQDNHVAL